MKAVVKAMGEAEVQGDAIRKSCDQPCVPRMPPVTAARPGTTSEGEGDSRGRGQGNPLQEIGTIDCFPSIDWVGVKQVLNAALGM